MLGYLNYVKSIAKIQKRGIVVFGSFIFGLDGDTKEVFRDVVTFMDDNYITGQLTIATPLPGTRMEQRLKRKNRLLPAYGQWDRCTFFDVLFEPQSITAEELEEGFVWAYEQIFAESRFNRRAEHLKSIYRDLHAEEVP